MIMPWRRSFGADPVARQLADRHYNRRAIGATRFAPPGRLLVLVIPGAALWISSWQFPQYVKHAWPGAWLCTAFRNERPDLYLSSELIRSAVAATCATWEAPPLGMITFVDTVKTRRKRDPGRCYRRAGFVDATPSHTAGGLVALQLEPGAMPPPTAPLELQGTLFDEAIR